MPADPETYDVTLFVTMLNGIPGSKDTTTFLHSEESPLGAQPLHICRLLNHHHIAVV